MSDRHTLDEIAALVTAHEHAADRTGGVTVLAVGIREILNRRQAERDSKADTRALFASDMRAAAIVTDQLGERLGDDFTRALETILTTAASFVEHGSDLGGGLMPFRFRTLAQAVTALAATDPGAALATSAPEKKE
jgi:hypothetical protein